jgi:hypothetical protein
MSIYRIKVCTVNAVRCAGHKALKWNLFCRILPASHHAGISSTRRIRSGHPHGVVKLSIRVRMVCLQVVGRLANAIVPVLLGKTKPIYDPSRDCGDFVVVTNCDRAVFTGSKEKDKNYIHHTGYPGGLKV